jgi:phosphoglycerate kinase
MKTIDQAPVSGKRVLVRVDFNVPLQEGKVTDDRRIREAIPSIKHILENGGSAVLMSHLGRPKEGPEAKFSLNQTIDTLKSYVDAEVLFADDCISEQAFEMSQNLKAGQILLLENLRFYKEEKKETRHLRKSWLATATSTSTTPSARPTGLTPAPQSSPNFFPTTNTPVSS